MLEIVGRKVLSKVGDNWEFSNNLVSTKTLIPYKLTKYITLQKKNLGGMVHNHIGVKGNQKGI